MPLAGTVSRNIQQIALALTSTFRIPERKIEISEDEVRAAFIDATERPIHCPKTKQKASYSGKLKRHTIKHQVVIRKKKQSDKAKQKVRIASVSKSAKWPVHNKVFTSLLVILPRDLPLTGGLAIKARQWRCLTRSRGRGN